MRDRKPKPTYLKLITGNPGGRPLNVDEPEPEGDLRDPPARCRGAELRYGLAVAIDLV